MPSLSLGNFGMGIAPVHAVQGCDGKTGFPAVCLPLLRASSL